MNDLLQKINARLQHYNRDELMGLIWDFLTDRDEDDLAAFLFTRPDPATALQTDLDVMKQHLFTALGMLNPDLDAVLLEGIGDEEYDQTLIDLSDDLSSYGSNRRCANVCVRRCRGIRNGTKPTCVST
ncbi:MAG: hypothetical protein EI684_08280 [Candidatus Viridilinea halotolerans]|uniref:Uncharacterized protein n=1 Tax=Candidatus Viridilinea halotolerans TaxID=2491704 RepID=A0A426U2F7_9CHLR|nr:MAG: hypothetical protein EI684_08280 [Candidatus Viridilinea halotolerans]